MDWKDCTVFLLRSDCILTTSIAYPPRPFHIFESPRYVHTTLYKTILLLLHIHSVLNTSVVHLQPVFIASMSCPAIKYKYFTEFHIITCVSTFIMNTQNQKLLLQYALFQGNQPLRKHAYSNTLKILQPKNFRIKILIFFIFFLKT